MVQNTVDQVEDGRLACRSSVARWGLCALFLLPLAAFAGQGNGPISLKMKFVPNETIKYQTSMQMDITMRQSAQAEPMKMPMTMSMVQDWQVTKINPDGSAMILTTTHDMQSKMNGQTMPNGAAGPASMTLHISPQGKVLSTQGAPGFNATNPFGSLSLNGMGAFLPTKPVKPGDTWTQSINLPGFTGGGGTAKSTLVSFENVGHFKTARIRTVATIPLNVLMGANGRPTHTASQAMMRMNGLCKVMGDTNFAIAEGKIIRSAVNGNINMSMKTNTSSGKSSSTARGGPQSMTMRMKMTMAMNMIQ
jgi:hypothetical protein